MGTAKSTRSVDAYAPWARRLVKNRGMRAEGTSLGYHRAALSCDYPQVP
jgi:hypothetical protein